MKISLLLMSNRRKPFVRAQEILKYCRLKFSFVSTVACMFFPLFRSSNFSPLLTYSVTDKSVTMVDQPNTAKHSSLTPDVLEAASILMSMKSGMRYFPLEAQQARYQLSFLDFNSLNPGSGPLQYFSGHHRIPFSPLYDISPMPAAYHFPLAHAQACSLPQPVAYYGMLTPPPCFVGPPREQSAGSVASTEGVAESEIVQPGEWHALMGLF